MGTATGKIAITAPSTANLPQQEGQLDEPAGERICKAVAAKYSPRRNCEERSLAAVLIISPESMKASAESAAVVGDPATSADSADPYALGLH